VSVAASPLNRGYGSSEPWVFDAQKPARLYARALPVGPARVSLALYGRYIAGRSDDFESYDRDRVERVNIDDEANARFNRLPDEGRDSVYTPGPSVLLAARAERGDRVVTLDMALNVSTSGPRSFSDDFGIPVDRAIWRDDERPDVEVRIHSARSPRPGEPAAGVVRGPPTWVTWPSSIEHGRSGPARIVGGWCRS
jgi:hypothetical protein